MEKHFLKIASIAALSFLMACNNGPQDEALQGKIEDGQILNPSTLSKTENEIRGTGIYRLDRTLPSTLSSKGLELKAALPSPNSKIEIVFFALNDTSLVDGVHLILSRNGNSVSGTLENNQTGVRNITANISALNPIEFEVAIDVHGYVNYPRVFLFPSLVAANNQHIFDSQRAGDLNNTLASSPMPGRNVGVILNDARVIHLQLRDTITTR